VCTWALAQSCCSEREREREREIEIERESFTRNNVHESVLFIATPSVTLALSAFTTTTVSLFFFNNTCTRAYTHPRVNVGQLWIVVLFLPVFSSLVFFLVENDATRRNVLYKCRVDPANNFYQV
jgi:hypothetical protein